MSFKKVILGSLLLAAIIIFAAIIYNDNYNDSVTYTLEIGSPAVLRGGEIVVLEGINSNNGIFWITITDSVKVSIGPEVKFFQTQVPTNSGETTIRIFPEGIKNDRTVKIKVQYL